MTAGVEADRRITRISKPAYLAAPEFPGRARSPRIHPREARTTDGPKRLIRAVSGSTERRRSRNLPSLGLPRPDRFSRSHDPGAFCYGSGVSAPLPPPENCPTHGNAISGLALAQEPSVYGAGVAGHDHLMDFPGGDDFNIAWKPMVVLFTPKELPTEPSTSTWSRTRRSTQQSTTRTRS